MTQILIVQHGVVDKDQEKQLRDDGIHVIACSDPSAARLLNAEQAVDSNDLLWAAVTSLGKTCPKESFANRVAELVDAHQHQRYMVTMEDGS